MLPVVYSMSVSLDGYIAGPGDDISWSAPDPDVMRFHIEQTRDIAVHLCGRKLYETMLVWETAEQTMSDPADLEFAEIWRAIPKIVFSRTLTSVRGNARLATADIATEIARLRAQPTPGVISVGGAGLAASAIAADLIDEYRRFVLPAVIGAGTPYYPPHTHQLGLELTDSRILADRVAYLRHTRIR